MRVTSTKIQFYRRTLIEKTLKISRRANLFRSRIGGNWLQYFQADFRHQPNISQYSCPGPLVIRIKLLRHIQTGRRVSPFLHPVRSSILSFSLPPSSLLPTRQSLLTPTLTTFLTACPGRQPLDKTKIGLEHYTR